MTALYLLFLPGGDPVGPRSHFCHVTIGKNVRVFRCSVGGGEKGGGTGGGLLVLPSGHFPLSTFRDLFFFFSLFYIHCNTFRYCNGNLLLNFFFQLL